MITQLTPALARTLIHERATPAAHAHAHHTSVAHDSCPPPALASGRDTGQDNESTRGFLAVGAPLTGMLVLALAIAGVAG